MPGHLVQVMVLQLTPGPSLSLSHVALGRCGGSLLLCGIGTSSPSQDLSTQTLPLRGLPWASPELCPSWDPCPILFSSSPLQHPPRENLSARCVGCHLQVSVFFPSVETSEVGNWEFSDWAQLSALSCFLEERMWSSGSASQGQVAKGADI